jgi:hypothetical protein
MCITLGKTSFVDWLRLTSSLVRAEHTAGIPDCEVGDDLIGVHVGLRAGAALENRQWEFCIPPAIHHFLCATDNQVGFLLR